MSLLTVIKRNLYTTFMLVQIVFITVQIFVFYPCIVSAPAEWYNKAMHPIETVVNSVQLQQPKVDSRKYKPNWQSLQKRKLPDWYDEAKIGVLLQWGVFSVPSFVDSGSKGLSELFWFYWKHDEDFVEPNDKAARKHYKDLVKHADTASRSVKEYMTRTYPPGWHYTDFASQFTAEFFDPDHWAEILKSSGAKYVVLTAKHHDGFAMWGSKQSWNWNSVDMGPHRDIVGELGEAVKKAGLRYGLYHSLYEWFHPLYNADKKNDFLTQHFIEEKLMPELRHLVMTYEPDLLWSDGHLEAPCNYFNCTQFLAWLYSDSPVRDHVVTNDRWGLDVMCRQGGFIARDDHCYSYFQKADQHTGGKWLIHGTGCHKDNQLHLAWNSPVEFPSRECKHAIKESEDDSQLKKWEDGMPIDKESGGYRRNAQLDDYTDMDTLLEMLAQTISYGGNLLLEVGPTSDGRLPPLVEERLRQLGQWLQVNGEAIYETQPWHTAQDRLNKDVYYTMRNTPDGIIIYCIIVQWPKDDRLPLGSPKIDDNTKVSWLGYQGNYEITFENIPAGIILVLPKVSLADIPCNWAWVLTFRGLVNAVG